MMAHAPTLAWRLAISPYDEAESVLSVRAEPEPVTVALIGDIQILRGRLICTLSSTSSTCITLHLISSYRRMNLPKCCCEGGGAKSVAAKTSHAR